MATAIWIALGGAVGTIARFGIAGAINETGHPWGTVVVNVLGSLALGLIAGLWGVDHGADHQLAVTVGMLGGFTTFSTFALDSVQLWENGQGALAMTTVVISVVVGIGAAVGGLAIGRGIAP